MSSVWFYAKVIPRPADSPFTEAVDVMPKIMLEKWFELWYDGVYWGWVFIHNDGTMEFGEPAT